MRPARSPRLGLLEVGRGIAALAAVLHHAALSADAFTSGNHAPIFAGGALGVDFFFVLSGFIITHAHRDDSRTTSAALRFVVRRIRRIYVPYLPISLGLIALYLLMPGLSAAGDRQWGWLTSLTLIPTDRPPALSVAWTLVYEMVFYTVFLLFYATQNFFTLMIFWALVVITIWGSGFDTQLLGPILATLLNPLILEFLAGMLMARLYSLRGGDRSAAGGRSLRITALSVYPQPTPCVLWVLAGTYCACNGQNGDDVAHRCTKAPAVPRGGILFGLPHPQPVAVHHHTTLCRRGFVDDRLHCMRGSFDRRRFALSRFLRAPNVEMAVDAIKAAHNSPELRSR